MKHFRTIFQVLLVFMFFIPAVVFAAVIDQGQLNMDYAEVFHDQKHEESVGRINGEYLTMYFDVITGGFLDSIDDVTSVTVRHTPSGRIYNLNYETSNSLGVKLDSWILRIAPTSVTLDENGVWEFTLCYLGNDGNTHHQIYNYNMGPLAPPARPHHVKIEHNGTNYIVSWTGIGSPYCQSVDYRVRVFDGADRLADLRGNWRSGYSDGAYDGATNWVTFTIPPIYGAGQEIRIENRVFTGAEGHMNRHSMSLKLPHMQ